jgi:hypothetical protein
LIYFFAATIPIRPSPIIPIVSDIISSPAEMKKHPCSFFFTPVPHKLFFRKLIPFKARRSEDDYPLLIGLFILQYRFLKSLCRP